MTRDLVAPWIAAQVGDLRSRRSHALLLQGPTGLGQYELALELARVWLCQQPGAQGACHACGSCHALDVRTHADLFVLMPETVLLELGWPLGEKAQADIDEKKRKPSKEIRVDAMREVVEFSQRTSAAGGDKVVLVYPAERMNAITANALLKTLEEPPGAIRFVLASESAHQLLPTIRSRCQSYSMAWPRREDAINWLTEQGLSAANAATLLLASGLRPADALRLANAELVGDAWSSIPKALQRGDGRSLHALGPLERIDILQKVCHDVQSLAVGGAPRFFAPQDLPSGLRLPGLSQWARDLVRARRVAEHPFNAGLMAEALLDGAQNALNSRG